MNPAIIAIALELVLKYAPGLFVEFVAIFSKGEPTPEAEAALTAKLVKLVNPSQYYDKT